MKRLFKTVLIILLAALILSGCTMRTVDQMYRLPKRSEDYSNLQSVMDKAMVGLKFSAPLSGDNQQNVQIADLDGDGNHEYLVFAKGTSELPLRILIFDRIGENFVHIDTIQSNGTAFDQVEYVQMDEKPGVELVVGHQLSDQVVRSVSIYSFAVGASERMATANYRKFLIVDMEGDGQEELFVLHPGQSEGDNGIAEIYRLKSDVVERSNEISISAPVDKLKRVLVGRLSQGKTAVFVASTVGDSALVTDVFTYSGRLLTNIIRPAESGIGVQTLRNYYVYADDIDNDGVTELPKLVTTVPLGKDPASNPRNLILWYALESDGTPVNKMHTFYNSEGGWYLKIDDALAPRIAVQVSSNIFTFYLWNEDYSQTQKLMTVYMLTGQNRDEQSASDGRFVLLKTDTAVYAASLESVAAEYQLTQEKMIVNFNLIHRDWNFGEM